VTIPPPTRSAQPRPGFAQPVLVGDLRKLHRLARRRGLKLVDGNG
jgi:hypothetical protein